MPGEFVIARNPDEDSTLPYVLMVPLPDRSIVLKAREAWPRTAKVYCHRVEEWPEDAEILERLLVRSCVRRGAAIDLVLERGRENRSQFVLTNVRGGREAVFWQSARTTKQARPRVSTPTARASGLSDLEIIIDSHERYAWKFGEQQVTTRVGPLAAGDYAVEHDGRVVAAVERKSAGDLVSSMTTGKLKYQLADLAALPRAALVVEERYSGVLAHDVVRASVIAEGVAECQVSFPTVPIIFCDNRKLAQEWAFRFLGAAVAAAHDDALADARVAAFASGADLPPKEPTPAEIRVWARGTGIEVSPKGRVPSDVVRRYREAHDLPR